MAQNPHKHITVDGVRYNLENGRAVAMTAKSQAPAGGRSTLLDLRSPVETVRAEKISALQQHLPSPSQTQPQIARSIQPKKVGRKPIRAIKKDTTQASHLVDPKEEKIDFFSFVFLHSLWPKTNVSLMQLSLLRTICSPQTWLLLTLPLILLQIRVLKHLTLNESLAYTKNFIAPDHYQAITWAIGVALVAFMVGVIIRSSVSASGLYVRLREFDSRPVGVLRALRSASHSIFRQSLNYILHFIIIILVSIAFGLLASHILSSTNAWLGSSRYQLVFALAFAWLGVIVLLYSKHWLQIGLLARSNNKKHLQLRSFKLVFAMPLRNFLISIWSIFWLIVVYGSIVLAGWQITNYFVAQSQAPVIWLLILEVVMTVILLTLLQYFQQNMWARHYYFIANQSSDRADLLYSQREKPESLWPFAIAIAVAGSILLIYTVLVIFSASRMRGYLANIHASIPDTIQFVVPIKK